MIEVEHTLEIERSAEDVFDYLADVARLPEWQESAERVEVEGELHEGARFREVRSFLGRRATSTLEVTEYVRPTRFSLHVVEGPVKYAVEHALDDLGDRTRVTFVARGGTQRIPRLLRGTAGRVVERQFVKDLESLKRRLEETSEPPVSRHRGCR